MDGTAFWAAFGLVFIAELGDKTQLAVVMQTCKHRVGLPVFVGASVALTVVTALGAVGGRAIALWIPTGVLRAAAAAAFVIMGALIWREATSSDNATACDTLDACVADDNSVERATWRWPAMWSTFGLLVVAELGDKTQLSVLTLATRAGSPWAVFLGGSLALTAVTGLAVLGGQQLCRLIPQRVLLRTSAVLFVAMGVLMALGVI